MILELCALPLVLVAAGAIALSSWLVARALLCGASQRALLCGAVVAGHVQLVVWFELLGAARMFRLAPALVAIVAAAVLAYATLGGRKAFAEMRSVAESAGRVLAGLRESRVAVACALLIGGLALAKVLRSAVAPGLATDTLLYHTPRAAAWVSAGGFTRFGAPDVWTIYDFYPPGGDVPWAWCMLLTRSEALIGAASVLVWAEVALGMVSAARELGASHARAAQIALVVVATPAVAAYVGTAYVDVQVLAFFAIGTVLLAAAAEKPSAGRGAMAASAFALALGVKIPAGVLLPLGFFAATWAARGTLGGIRAAAAWVAGWAAGSVPVWPHVVRAWAATGSPIHPFGLRIGSLQIFPVNETWDLVSSARMYVDVKEDLPAFLRTLFGVRMDWRADQTGFGPSLVVLIVLAAVGVARGSRGRSWLLAFLLAVAAAFFAGVIGPSALGSRTGAAMHTARYLLAGMGAIALLAGMARGRAVDVALVSCLALNAVLALPLGWGRLDAAAVGAVAPAALAVISLVAAAAMVQRRRLLFAVGAVATAVAAWPWTMAVRATHRADYLAALEARTLYDIHPPGRIDPGARRVWEVLDQAPPSRVAVTAGWNGEGMHWYISPLLGHDVRHEIVYVPPTRDGTTPSYRKTDDLIARSAYGPWHRRLLAERVDYVATLPPPGLERAWIDRHQQHFEPVAASDSLRYVLFRVLKPVQ
jgi:hypothetical protein